MQNHIHFHSYSHYIYLQLCSQHSVSNKSFQVNWFIVLKKCFQLTQDERVALRRVHRRSSFRYIYLKLICIGRTSRAVDISFSSTAVTAFHGARAHDSTSVSHDPFAMPSSTIDQHRLTVRSHTRSSRVCSRFTYAAHEDRSRSHMEKLTDITHANVCSTRVSARFYTFGQGSTCAFPHQSQLISHRHIYRSLILRSSCLWRLASTTPRAFLQSPEGL